MIPERVLLHLGTHKTATTHVQMSLRGQSGVLEDQGIAYIPLQPLRRSVTRLVWDSSATPATVRAAIDPLCGRPRLIFSDENLLGFPREIRAGKLYAQAGRNLERLTGALPETEFRALITLRGYAGFLVSMYCEYLRHNPFTPFRHFSRRMPLARMTWMPLLDTIAAVLGKENLQVAFFEDLKGDFQPLFDWFGEGLVSGAEPGSGAAGCRRATLSSEAVERLRSVARSDSPAAAQALLKQWESTGDSPPGATYSPFRSRHLKVAATRYGTEQDQVRRKFRTLT